MDETKVLRIGALRRLLKIRTCPPVSVLQKKIPQVMRHLESCQFCRSALADLESLENLGEMLLRYPCPEPAFSKVQSGDIRWVKPLGKPEDWFDGRGRYHNPPKVLILDTPDRNGFVSVAQMFDSQALAEAGNVPVNGGKSGFAEAWNIYNLPVSGLSGECLHHASRSDVDAVWSTSKLEFEPLAEFSERYQFHQLEFATGSFFSLRLNEQALNELEERAKNQVDQAYVDLGKQEEAEKLAKILSTADFSNIFPSGMNINARTLPERIYAYAASDGKRSYKDNRTGSTVTIHGRDVRIDSMAGDKSLVIVLDGSGELIPMLKPGLGIIAKDAGITDSFIRNDNVASVVPLKPNQTGLAVILLGEAEPKSIVFATYN